MFALWKSFSPHRMWVVFFGPPRSTRATASRRARSITESESSSVFATQAVFPSGATATPRGLSFVSTRAVTNSAEAPSQFGRKSRRSSSGVRRTRATSFSTSMTATRFDPALVATAVFPSGVKATSVTSAK